MNKHHLAKWAAAPILTAGLLIGGALAANAATGSAAQITPNVAPGSNTQITASINNVGDGSGLSYTSMLNMVWQAPPNSVFTNNQIGYATGTNGNPIGTPNYSSNGCSLSNGNKTLTCTGNWYTLPAGTVVNPATGSTWASYGQFFANITTDPGTPYNSTFMNTLSWTSNNGEISSATVSPGFRTPAEAPVPVVDPLVSLGAAAALLGTGATVAFSKHRRARA